MALTSANVSGAASPLRIEDFRDLWIQCAVVYDGGAIPASPDGSTIVDLSQEKTYAIVRPGIALDATRTSLQKYGLEES